MPGFISDAIEEGDSRYTGSDNEDDDFNDFKMNKGFIQSFSDT